MARFDLTEHDRSHIEAARKTLAAAASVNLLDGNAMARVIGRLEVAERGRREVGEGFRVLLADQHQRSVGGLLRTHQHQPVGGLCDQGVGVAELAGRRVGHDGSMGIRGRAARRS